MIVYHMSNRKPIEIALKHTEVQKAHGICKQNKFETDFANRYHIRYTDGIRLQIL